MSHRPAIFCDECRMPLGEKVGPTSLRLLSSGSVILGPASAAIECPRCHRPRVWAYSQTVSATTMLHQA